MSARETWTEGSQWRVIREGARLSGMVSRGPGWHQGWGRALAVGEVVTCLGFKMGWGSDSIPEVMFSTPDSIEAGAVFVNINPQVGMWYPYPQDGYLERVPSVTEGEACAECDEPADVKRLVSFAWRGYCPAHDPEAQS